jgi:hypothetical protein
VAHLYRPSLDQSPANLRPNPGRGLLTDGRFQKFVVDIKLVDETIPSANGSMIDQLFVALNAEHGLLGNSTLNHVLNLNRQVHMHVLMHVSCLHAARRACALRGGACVCAHVYEMGVLRTICARYVWQPEKCASKPAP